jgi:hypothetical protein
MNNFSIEENNLILESSKGKEIISLNKPILKNFVTAVKTLFDSLRQNKCDWKMNDNIFLMNVIQQGLVFTKKLKNMNTNNKKKLILLLLFNLLDNEIKENNELISLKEKIVEGIETIIEPAIELAMMTQNNEFKIPKNFLWNVLSICRRSQTTP